MTAGTRPVVSRDGRTWVHLSDAEVAWDDRAKELTLRLRPEGPTLWVAHVPPYLTTDLDALREAVAGHPAFAAESIGQTPGGRAIWLWTITDPATPDAAKRTIAIMARQHAWEAGTSWVVEGLVRRLVADDPEAAEIRRRFVFKILPMCDPDGVVAGAVRFNAHGVDLNRHWDAVDPATMPEVSALRRAIWGWLDDGRPIDLFLAFHTTESVDYLEGPRNVGGGRVADLADRLHAALQAMPEFDSPEGPRDSEREVIAGRMKVHEALWKERRVPAFLLELRVQFHPKLGRGPTVSDQLAMGGRLPTALRASLGDEG